MIHRIDPISVVILCFAGMGMSPAYGDELFRQFRGPRGDGIAPSDRVHFDLDAQYQGWRTPTPETGWSSPITDGERLWMTAAKTTAATPEQKAAKLVDAKFADMKEVMGSVELLAICLDAQTGDVLHRIVLDRVEFPNSINAMNSFASPTGCWFGDRVVLHFGRYGTFCLDSQTGQSLWKQTLVIDDSMGPGSSAAVAEGVVVIPCDGMDKQFVSGLSLATGDELWRTDRPEMDTDEGEFRKSYSSPLVIEVSGRSQAIIPCAQWCVAYDVISGEEVWRFRHGSGFSISPSPIYADGKVIFSSGYGGKELLAIDPNGTGDVTSSHVVWRSRVAAPMMPSVAVANSSVHSIAEGGILVSVRLDDGSLQWRERLGGKYSASPLVSGDRLIIGDHDGNVTVFRAGEAFELIGRFELGEQIMASPIAIGDDLILRTKEAVYRFSAVDRSGTMSPRRRAIGSPSQ